ncbi:MAG: class I SAM-dependent methyltransferase [Candidatus Moranbacteria bacterium]|nr:class I SAM-dependent methyltransferase [Candidatus Moranbacteria bacterium]
MKINSFAKHEERWQKMAKLWSLYSKYSRPSPEDIRHFNEYLQFALKGISEPLVVLLGATPEIRDLLLKYSKKQKAKIICVDMTKDMFMAMSHLTHHKNSREQFVLSNWLSISKKMKPKSVDVVIGDFVIGNVGEHEKKFLKEVSSILKSNGFFITRAYYHTDRVQKVPNFVKELRRLAQRVKRGKYTIKDAKEYFMNNTMYSTWYLRKDNKVSLSYRQKEYENIRNDTRFLGRTEGKIFKSFWKAWWPLRDKYWTDLPKNELQSIIRRHFIIRKTLFSHDYERAEFCPIYLLRKKK